MVQASKDSLAASLEEDHMDLEGAAADSKTHFHFSIPSLKVLLFG